MNPDLDTLVVTVYATVRCICWSSMPEWLPELTCGGERSTSMSDAELVTLAVIQSLLRYTSEARV